MLGQPAARITFFGADPQRVRAAALRFDEVQQKHMHRAMQSGMDILEEAWRLAAPRRTGGYLEGIQTRVIRMGEISIGTAWNEREYAEEVERGSGIHRSGPGPKRRITAKPPNKYLKIPGRSGRTIFLRSVAGQRPQWTLRRAHNTVRHRIGLQFKLAAFEAKRETLRAIG